MARTENGDWRRGAGLVEVRRVGPNTTTSEHGLAGTLVAFRPVTVGPDGYELRVRRVLGEMDDHSVREIGTERAVGEMDSESKQSLTYSTRD